MTLFLLLRVPGQGRLERVQIVFGLALAVALFNMIRSGIGEGVGAILFI